MENKTNIIARIQQLHNTEEVWSSSKYSDFIPRAGEIIIFDVDSTHNFTRFKFGDGVTPLKHLPFAINPIGEVLEDGSIKIDAGRV